MIDLVSVIIGMLLIILFLIFGLTFLPRYQLSISISKIDSSIANDIVNEVPRCPDCGSFDLTLIDNYDGLPWLKPYTTEIDYYQCNRCARRFNDEDWQNAKHYNN